MRQRDDAEYEELLARLEEAEETLRAIRSGEVDALVVSTPEGEQLFTLQGADESYRVLIERMNEGALSVSDEGVILYANQRFAAMLRSPLEKVIGSHLEAWVAPDQLDALHLLLENGKREQCRAEMSLSGADGDSVPVYLSLSPVPIDGVRQTYGVVATDLAEQKRAERAIRLSETKFRDVFEHSLLGKRLINMDGSQQVNQTFCDITGYSAEEVRHLNWRGITHPDDIPATAEAFKQLEAGALTSLRLEKRFIHKNGTIIWADVTYTSGLDENGKPLYILVAMNDITARKQADEALLDLKQHLQRNIEMERLRLAQDLHDVPLQEIYAVIYQLEDLRSKSDGEASEVVGEVLGNLRKTLVSLRATASELRPPALSRFGLEKAIRSYMQDFREKNPGLQVQLSLAEDHQILPEDVRLVLFRSMQEALANVVRHAQANQVLVRFNFDAEEARLEVLDDGKGFVVPRSWLTIVPKGHYGLAGMAERVNAAGGLMEVESAPGASTIVRVILPYNKAE